MNSFLRITVRFLQPLAHGRKDGGEPEWPPSPFRLFQALVAASAGRWNERLLLNYAVPALAWLERQIPTVIVAPTSVTTDTPYLLYVPNNTADLLVPAWKQGDVTKSTKREQKPVRPTHLADEAVHYLFPLPEDRTEFEKHRGTLQDAARSITHLGWGVDMVAADAKVITQAEADKLSGHRWRVVPSGGTPLRVPKAGTLDNLIDKHKAFLGRLSADGFKPVPPLQCFDVVGYASPTVPSATPAAPRPVVAFELRTPDFGKFQPYDPCRRTRDVAGMVRRAVADLAARMRPFGWTDEHINMFVHGHTPDGRDRATGPAADRRFTYLPLPSVLRYDGGSKVGDIRRVLIAAPPECRDAVMWAKVLSGHELTPERDTRPATLRLIDRPESALASDPNLGPYLGTSASWSTVTPVVLHRHDIDDPAEIRRRLVDAFRHAGLSGELLEGVDLEWGRFGYRAGVEPAFRYIPADTMTGPRYHVRVCFRQEVRGPLAVGAGRYRGFGLFIAER